MNSGLVHDKRKCDKARGLYSHHHSERDAAAGDAAGLLLSGEWGVSFSEHLGF